MKNSRIRRYREMIEKLSIENEELKLQLKKYDESGFIKLVDETLKMKKNMILQ